MKVGEMEEYDPQRVAISDLKSSMTFYAPKTKFMTYE